MDMLELVKSVLRESLQLGERVDDFDMETVLIGGIPEFDSVAVVSIITALEEATGIEFDDDDISAEVFETIGSLVKFLEVKEC